MKKIQIGPDRTKSLNIDSRLDAEMKHFSVIDDILI
jgi:hypothetical protein